MDLDESVKRLFSLPLENYQEFLDSVENCQKRIHNNANPPLEETVFNSLHEFWIAPEVPGLFCVPIRKVPFHCRFSRRASDSLVVMFNGARVRRGKDHKMFPFRFSYQNMLDSSFLFIDDPQYYLYDDLALGWYYGYHDCPFLLLANALILLLLKKCGIDRNKVTFFASSGGGYAALYASAKFRNSLSISVNPQLVLSSYPYYKQFKEIVGHDLEKPDKYHRNSMAEVLKKSESRHLIVVNSQAMADIKDHLLPVLKELGITPRYGLAQKNNILVWLYDACGASVNNAPPIAHNSVETRSIFMAMYFIASSFRPGFQLEFYHALALLANMFWWEFYDLKKEIPTGAVMSDVVVCDAALPPWKYELEEIAGFHIGASDVNYNFKKLFKIQPSLSYFISFIFEGDGQNGQFSFGLFDFSRNRIVNMQTRERSGVQNYSFFSGERPECYFIVYAGEIGKTKGLELSVKTIRIGRAPLN